MSPISTKEDLEKMQVEMKAIHARMHAYAKLYPHHERTFLGVAFDLTNAVWKLDDVVDII